MWTIVSFLGLGSAGVISTLYLLWSRSNVRGDLNTANGKLSKALDDNARLTSELQDTQALYKDQLARRDAEIKTLNAQKAQLLDAMQKSNVPGDVRNALWIALGVSDPKSTQAKSP